MILKTQEIKSVNEAWCYDEAFSRHRGLLSEGEQQKLQATRIGIAGLGGVGGVHLTTLARLGIGNFTIADADHFSVANINRQRGAMMSSVGKEKSRVMQNIALDINPDLNVKVIDVWIDETNIEEFLDGVDIYVDALDFFAIETRRLVFRECARRGIWAITAGPIGFSTAWLCFDPKGMSFDEYFDLNDSMSRRDMLISFAIGLTPKATHLGYTDLSTVDVASGKGPSAGLACQMSAGVVAAKVVDIITERNQIKSVPCFSQFDAFRGVFKTGKLNWGNRGPLQRIKRHFLKKRISKLPGFKIEDGK